jgi:hypothetical protein
MSGARGAQEMGVGRAARKRLAAWAKMTSRQKLADMEKEDRRRKRGRK